MLIETLAQDGVTRFSLQPYAPIIGAIITGGAALIGIAIAYKGVKKTIKSNESKTRIDHLQKIADAHRSNLQAIYADLLGNAFSYLMEDVKLKTMKKKYPSDPVPDELRNVRIQSITLASNKLFDYANGMFVAFTKALIVDDNYPRLESAKLLKQRVMNVSLPKSEDTVDGLLNELQALAISIGIQISKEHRDDLRHAQKEGYAPQPGIEEVNKRLAEIRASNIASDESSESA